MTRPPEAEVVIAERLRRQRFLDPLPTRKGYEDLFRLLQPVSTVYYTRPGDPPRLVGRTKFDDGKVTDRLRSKRTIVKGRFLGGNLGYVLADDLADYANAFAKPLPRPNATQEEVLGAVRSAGPVTPRQLREETGLLSKKIMPALHRLQEAFLVYEDQTDSDWDRPWYEFENEWPDVEVREELGQAARERVLLRFLESHVFATYEQIVDWSRLARRTVSSTLQVLERDGAIVATKLPELGEGWVRSRDTELRASPGSHTVFMLHKADPLVRSHASELKRRFGRQEVLEYLLVDGRFAGAVLGHWRFAPYDVEDIVVELPTGERTEIRDDVLRAVRAVYSPPRHHVRRYGGAKVD